jgi:hypothetical protein
MNLFSERGYERWNVSGLGEIVIHLFPDGFQGSLEIGISSKNKGRSGRLNASHCANQDESIGWTANVQVSEQHIEWLMIDGVERLRDRCSNRYFESLLLENSWESKPNRLLVIHE